MRSLAQQADALLGVLDEATAVLHTHLLAPSVLTLASLEIALDGVLVEYRQFLEELKTAGSPIEDHHEPFLRAMVAYSTIVQLLSPQIGSGAGFAWGRHTFSDDDFAFIGFDHLPPDLPLAAVQRILPDQVADLKSALGAVGASAGYLQGRMRDRISDAFAQICGELDCVETNWESLDMDLKDDAWVMRELAIDAKQLATMVADRTIISVPTWSGGRRFPSYQIELGVIVHAVEYVCENTPPTFRDWPLAIWMARNLAATDEYFEEKLGSLGLWMPLWSGPATTQFKGIKKLKATTPLSPLFRVCRRSLSPFYFSSVDAARPAAGGRFDLAVSTGLGSLYTAETPFGAWSETLDRRPVVTLRELLSMRLWSLRALDQPDVADLTKVPGTNTNRRPDTQALAEAVRVDGWLGLRVPLRSRPTEIGVVMFGKTGPNLPATAGIGLWEALPTEGIEAASLWEYMETRQDLENDFPIVLRRFPSEMALTA